MGPGRKICIFPYETKTTKGVVKGLKYIHFSPLFALQVDVSTTSLDPTFSFVLDAGLKIYIWSGERVRTTWQLRACSLACHLFSGKNCTFVLFIFVFFSCLNSTIIFLMTKRGIIYYYTSQRLSGKILVSPQTIHALVNFCNINLM